MAKQLITEIDIQAPIEMVWEILTNFDAYSDWNPFIRSIEGAFTVGNIIKVNLNNNGKAMVFQPKVLAFEENKEFRWLGKVWVRGLFDGEHYFQLSANADGSTHFIHGENFSGLLVPLLMKMIGNDTKRSFENMNQQLKEVAERMVTKA